MQNSDIVRMANQIAAYFSPYPKSEAVDGIKKHLHAFWEPRMRNHLKDFLEQGGEGLDPLFVEAAHEYFKGPKQPLTPAPTSETKKKSANKGAEPSVNRGA